MVRSWVVNVLSFTDCFFNVFSEMFYFNTVPQGCENGMTLVADNPFICKKELAPFEKGIRIDYILFKVG